MIYATLEAQSPPQSGQARFLHQLPLLATILQHVGRSSSTIKLWKQRTHYRSELRRLQHVGTYLVKDVGLSHNDALRESEKPFWVE